MDRYIDPFIHLLIYPFGCLETNSQIDSGSPWPPGFSDESRRREVVRECQRDVGRIEGVSHPGFHREPAAAPAAAEVRDRVSILALRVRFVVFERTGGGDL